MFRFVRNGTCSASAKAGSVVMVLRAVVPVGPARRTASLAAAARHKRAAVAAEAAGVRAQAGADPVAVRNVFVAESECIVLAGLLGIDSLGGGRDADRGEGEQESAGRGRGKAIEAISFHRKSLCISWHRFVGRREFARTAAGRNRPDGLRDNDRRGDGLRRNGAEIAF